MEVLVGTAVGADVMGGVLVGSSRHLQKSPGVLQVEDVGVEAVMPVVVGLVGSRQPNHPRSWHVVDDVGVGSVVVAVGAGVAPVVVVGSLQPNQPGVLQVEVVVVVSDTVVVVVVVVGSRQPHQPGVLHVEVLLGEVVVLVVVVVVVVVSDPLLRKNFHSSQSKHSSSATHDGT